MRPLMLSMQAFGPFAACEQIDFEALGQSPLFLINGPTGAGKSSILDAICFALYGQTTGAEREGAQMRCDHSPANLLTEVTLRFELGSKRYQIRRVPMQERAKSRGEGTTTQQAEASLIELDGSEQGRLLVSKSVSEANQEIKRLMGLGVEQFRQVMVLPQGKFRELLMADSKEREAIFSQLFETHIYKKIESRLKEQAGDIRREVEAHRNELKGVLSSADLSSEQALEEQTQEAKAASQTALAERSQAEQALGQHKQRFEDAKRVNQSFEALARYQQDQKALDVQAADITASQAKVTQAQAAQAIFHIYNEHRNAGEALAALDTQCANAKSLREQAEAAQQQAASQREQANKDAEGLDKLKAEQQELMRIQGLSQQLAHAQQAHVNAQGLEQSASAKREAQQAHMQQALALIDNNKAEIAQLNAALEGFTEAKLAQEALAQKWRNAQTRDQLHAQQAQAQQVHNAQHAKLAQADAAWQSAQRASKTTEMHWHAGQAASLAAQLVPEQPCPVCGSCEHPVPAQVANDQALVTKEQVEQARVLEAQALKVLQAEQSKVADCESENKVLEAKVQATLQALAEHAQCSTADIQRAYQGASETLQVLEAKQQKLAGVNDALASHELSHKQAQAQLQSLDASLLEAQQALATAKANWQQLAAQLPEKYSNEHTLQAALKDLEARIHSIASAQQSAEQAFAACQSQLDAARSSEATLAAQHEQQLQTRKTAHAAWQQALEGSIFEAYEDFAGAWLNEQDLHAEQAKIQAYQGERDRLAGAIAQLQGELEGCEQADLAQLEQALSAVQLEFNAQDKNWRECDARLNQLNSLQQKLQQAHSKSAALNEQYAVLGTLSEVANGNTGQKLSLQRFVLSVLLDDVLIQASQRLRLMSKGRYQLVRKEARAKGNKASGLELEVEDGNTGKTRAVETLSGGESFMAALALALGLSDVVQAHAGGIKLDTLFIDEGFGSLDMASLDAAVQVLLDLQASGRTIGIISHVTELKEQMALRVDVHSSSEGSRVTVHGA